MSETTKLKLFKHDNPSTNINAFDIEKALNENWDKIDDDVGEKELIIAELKEENERLRNDLNGLPTGNVTGENINLTDSAEMRVNELKISGNSKQGITLPNGYTPVDYIESTGTQYIDTGVFATENTEYKIKFEYTQMWSTNNGFIICSRNSSTSENLSLTLDTTSGFIGRGNNYTQISTETKVNTIYEYEVKKAQIIKDGVEISTAENIFEETGTNSVHLFAGLQAGAVIRKAYARIYFCKIYERAKLIRELIPCYRNEDNTIGMYDTVNDTFYINVGTGTFLKGNNILPPSIDEPIEVESCGTNGSINITISNGLEKTDVNYKVQQYTIPTQQEMLDGDYFDLVNKKEVHKWLKVVANENSNWQVSIDSTHKAFQFILNVSKGNQSSNLKCNMVQRTYPINWAKTGALIAWNSKFTFIIAFNDCGFNESLTTNEALALFKEKLANNKLILYYTTTEPINLELTEEQVEILTKIEKEAKTYKGTTHIYSTDNISPIFEITYKKDVEARLLALETAILNS